MAKIPETHKDLLEAPLIADLATVRPDGGPQVNPVWFEWDGEHVDFSQTKTRQKVRNIEHEKRVSFSVIDPENPYRYLEVRGTVVAVDSDADNTFIDRQAQRYMGVEKYPLHQPGDERIVVRVKPDHFATMG